MTQRNLPVSNAWYASFKTGNCIAKTDLELL